MARPRGREIDLAIAACALVRAAALWTLNRDDFSDIEGLPLYDAPRPDARRPASETRAPSGVSA